MLPFLLALAACGQGTSAPTAKPTSTLVGDGFPALSGRVVDAANLIPADAEAALTARSAELEAKTGHQLVVATVPGLGGRTIADYSLKLANNWGVGRKGVNDGVVIVVAPKEGKVRIEVGTGLESTLTNAKAQGIVDAMLPAFAAHDFARGITSGVDGVIAQIGPGAK